MGFTEPIPTTSTTTIRRSLAAAGAIAAAAGLLAWVLARRGRASGERERERIADAASRNGAPDAVEEASLESFPASDPPSWGSAGL